MLLTELIGIKKFATLTQDEVVNFLEKSFNAHSSQFKLLGTGVHAVAFQSGNNVYKFWMRDSAYHTYAEYFIPRQDNPFLPKIRSRIKKLPAFFLRDRSAPDHVFYIKMELLEPVKIDDQVLKFNLYADPTLTKKQIDFFKLVKLSKTRSVDEICEELKRPYRSEPTYEAPLDPVLLKVLETLADIKYLQDEMGFDDDLHGANIMKRGNQLVILDPLVDPDDAELNSKFYRFTKNAISGEGKQSIGKYGVTKLEK